MAKAIVKITITATVEETAEEFLSNYEMIHIKEVFTEIESYKGESVKLKMEDFEINGVEDLDDEE